MKKTLSIIMALLVVVFCMLSFSSCSSQTGGEPLNDDANVSSDSTPVAEGSVKDIELIQNNGKIIVGITEYPPMDYKDDKGEWTGFDADYARAVAEKLGVDVEFFVLADWDAKAFELESKNIDCVWNGMTISDSVKASMDISEPYVRNAQVVVMKAENSSKYTTLESMKELTFAVENGSAGAAIAKENGFKATTVTYQSDAVLEVNSGTADACIIDLTMANAMTGENSSYDGLKSVLTLNEEEYGIGFRKGSDLVAKVNEISKELKADGTLQKIAEKYNLTLVD